MLAVILLSIGSLGVVASIAVAVASVLRSTFRAGPVLMLSGGLARVGVASVGILAVTFFKAELEALVGIGVQAASLDAVMMLRMLRWWSSVM